MEGTRLAAPALTGSSELTPRLRLGTTWLVIIIPAYRYKFRGIMTRSIQFWHGQIKLLGFAVLTSLLTSLATANETTQSEPLLYVVNFTADWCPNCKVLDPALDKALASLGIPQDGDTRLATASEAPVPITHVELDLTNPARNQEAFEKVNGTVLGGVYGDYIGLTGLVVLIAADSGEKINCATRLVDSNAIAQSIQDALTIVKTTPAGTRETESIFCPPSNKKVRVE